MGMKAGKLHSCDHCLGSPTREIGAFSPGRKRPVACLAQHQRHASMIEDTQEAMFAERMMLRLPMSENLGIKMFGRCLVALRRLWTIHASLVTRA